MPRTKAQMEIMGLMLIVILVSLGFLMAFYFLARPAAKHYESARESVLATHWTNAMLGTMIPDCGDRTAEDLIRDCSAGGASVRCSGGQNSCEKVESFVDALLNSTLGAKKRNYYFVATMGGSSPDIIIGSPCPAGEAAPPRPIPMTPALVSMEICG
jgi:hypothetical protein